jgi:hypothetical protein
MLVPRRRAVLRVALRAVLVALRTALFALREVRGFRAGLIIRSGAPTTVMGIA